jgi:hypothetical protein
VGRDSSELSFVLNHPSKLAIGPLVQPLIHLAAVVDPITDAANVSQDDRRYTSVEEHIHDLPGEFMEEIRDFVVDVVELFTLRLDQLLPAIRTALFAVCPRVEFGLEAILVVAKCSKLPTVDREGVFSREDSGEVLLSEINSSHFVSSGSVYRFCVALSTDNEPIRSLPDLDGARLFIYGPVNQNRILSALRGQAKNAVVSESDALVGPSEYVVGLIRALRRVALPVVVVPRAGCFIELLCDLLGRLGRQHVVALTVPPAHCCFTDPVVLSVYRAPIPLADGVPQIRRRTRQPFKLLGAVNMKFASQVHGSGLVFNVLLGDLLTRFASRADKVGASRKGRKSMQVLELVSENVSTGSLESMNHLAGSMASIRLNKQMNVVGPDRQGAYLPVMLIRYFTEHLLQPIRNLVFEHIRSPLRTPNEVILHRAGGAGGLCDMVFVDLKHSINKLSCSVFQERSLTSRSTSHCEGARNRQVHIPQGATAPQKPEGLLLLRASSIL